MKTTLYLTPDTLARPASRAEGSMMMNSFVAPTPTRAAALLLTPLLTLMLLAGCAVTPPYVKPDVATPAAFKEAPPSLKEAPPVAGDWKPAQPAENAPRGEWWKVFGDARLDDLEAQAIAANQNLKAAAARLEESRAQQRAAQAAWFPELDAGFGPTRERVSPASQGLAPDASTQSQTLWRAQGSVSYEADLFGRVSASVDAARADTGQSEALFRSVQLALQADVAQNYFALRELDAEAKIYRQTVLLRERGLTLTQHRFDSGDISDLDVARARSELASARADELGVARRRASAEHSLATLLGKPPADFGLAAAPLTRVDVRVPAGLPSALLERRPDIDAAERAMAAANARVGLAKSAFFPQLDLTGSLGYEAGTLGNLFKWSSRTFVLGPLVGTALSLPIFDGGRREAGLLQARARYDEQTAMYRQTVLDAFRQVEDSLADLRIVADQSTAQDDAVRASQRAATLSRKQYENGSIAFLDVIDADRTVLQTQLVQAQLDGTRANAAVALIRALGGGWQGQPAATVFASD